MIFVDANVPMYVVGREHPYKARAQRMLERAVTDHDRLVTSAEVLQEILHRYSAIGRREAIQPAFDMLLGTVDEVFAINLSVVQRAKAIVLGYPSLSARDAIHVGTMQEHSISRVMSFDIGFDTIPGLSRISA